MDFLVPDIVTPMETRLEMKRYGVDGHILGRTSKASWVFPISRSRPALPRRLHPNMHQATRVVL